MRAAGAVATLVKVTMVTLRCGCHQGNSDLCCRDALQLLAHYRTESIRIANLARQGLHDGLEFGLPREELR